MCREKKVKGEKWRHISKARAQRDGQSKIVTRKIYKWYVTVEIKSGYCILCVRREWEVARLDKFLGCDIRNHVPAHSCAKSKLLRIARLIEIYQRDGSVLNRRFKETQSQTEFSVKNLVCLVLTAKFYDKVTENANLTNNLYRKKERNFDYY